MRGIYAIVDEDGRDPVAIARAALAGGVRILQYRAKHGIVAATARALRRATLECGALCIMNDDAEAAMTHDFDGVHVGPDDPGFADVASLRALLGERVIGVSCGTVAEAVAAEASGADYIGVGAVYVTKSKADAGEPMGIEGLKGIAAATILPVAAIGGIGLASIPAIRATGVAMAAVISAIADARDPRAAAEALVLMWNEGSV
ncbi:MAG: thiamine phosphate synthase [Candidatus Eremiobacteraeota bacterium]|nr:thiamine phosphate synthase [Candidatus Eremiobacteraeota bacterium]